MRFRIRLVMLLGILFLSMKAQAAPVLVVNGVGILTGARDIHLQVNLIDLGFWNVDFVDGTCAQVFGVCDIDHFPIRQQDLFAASEALSKTIFLDSAAGQFDSSPNLTNGCQGAGVQTCTVLMPDIIFFGPVLSTAGPRNLQGGRGVSGRFMCCGLPNYSTGFGPLRRSDASMGPMDSRFCSRTDYS